MKDVFSVKRSNDGDQVLKSLNGSFANVIDMAGADLTLKDSDSGSLVLIDATGASGGLTVTLPTVLQSGVIYKFVVKEDTPSQAVTVAAGSAIIFGNFGEAEVDTNDDGPGSSGATGISNIVVGTGAKKGCRFGIICDGTNWYLQDAFAQIDGSITTS